MCYHTRNSRPIRHLIVISVLRFSDELFEELDSLKVNLLRLKRPLLNKNAILPLWVIGSALTVIGRMSVIPFGVLTEFVESGGHH
jgi:hypothetical protein